MGIAAPGLASLLMNPQVAARADDAVNTILNRRRPIFNVRDAAFGARGDGVADDRPAIQAAIDAAALAGGGLVYLPAGVYWLRSVRVQAGVRFYLLNYYSGVVLAGAGIDRTILRAAAGLPDQTRIISSNSSDGLSLVRNATFRDFTIDGVAAQQPNAGSCVGISNVHTDTIAHLRVRVTGVKGTPDGEGTCYDSYSSTNVVYRDCEAMQLRGAPTGSGFSATQSTNITYQGCMSSGSAHWHGFTTFRSDQVQYLDCHGYRNAQRGLNCESSSNVRYVNCQAGAIDLGNHGDGIYIFRSDNVSVIDCISTRNQNGLVNLGSTMRVVRGRFIRNSKAGVSFGSDSDSLNSSLEGEVDLDANALGPTWQPASPAPLPT